MEYEQAVLRDLHEYNNLVNNRCLQISKCIETGRWQNNLKKLLANIERDIGRKWLSFLKKTNQNGQPDLATLTEEIQAAMGKLTLIFIIILKFIILENDDDDERSLIMDTDEDEPCPPLENEVALSPWPPSPNPRQTRQTRLADGSIPALADGTSPTQKSRGKQGNTAANVTPAIIPPPPPPPRSSVSTFTDDTWFNEMTAENEQLHHDRDVTQERSNRVRQMCFFII